MPCKKIIPKDSPALLVTYALRRPERKFNARGQAIARYFERRLGDLAWRVFPTTWVVMAARTPQQLHMQLRRERLFDAADRLVVVDLRGFDWAPFHRAGEPGLTNWLEAHSPPSRMVIHGRRPPPIYRHMNRLEGAVSMASTWFVSTREPVETFFESLTGPDLNLVDDRDMLSVVGYPPIAYQGFTPPPPPGVQVTYRRFKPQRGLSRHLRAKPEWWHGMGHVWVVQSDARADDLVTELEPTLGSFEGILVADLSTSDMACWGVEKR